MTTTPSTDPSVTFVLVHGAAGNSYTWAALTRELAYRGYRSLALDLPGHGLEAALPLSYQAPQDLAEFATARSHLADVTLRDYVDHTVAAVRRVAEHGPVVLVGASLGGAVITRVGDAVPELVSRVVYITAFCCVELPSMIAYMQTPEAATSLIMSVPGVGDPTRTGATRNNFRSADPELLRAAKAATAAELTDEQFRTILSFGVQPDESVQVGMDDARGDATRWGTIPRTYIRATQDRILPPALQDRMIREADALTPYNTFDVHSIDASHSGIVLRVSEIANIMTRTRNQQPGNSQEKPRSGGNQAVP